MRIALSNSISRLAAAAALACAGHCVSAHAAPSEGATALHAIDWKVGASDADIDKAFALGKQLGKPVFLYWGAVWCPPCNQVKATLFSRPDFVERSRAFVPVYVDGDKPGAQRIAARFKVSGYPTMILFQPDGTEITRLPGEVDPQVYLLTLTAGMNAQVPVKDLIQRGLAGQSLTAEQWRLLAYYSWDTDEQQILGTKEVPERLAQLASRVPVELPQVRDRLAFKSLAARAQAGGTPDAAAIGESRKVVDRLLANAEAIRTATDLLAFYADPVVAYLAPAGEERKTLASRWDAALGELLKSSALSRADQVGAWDSRVTLWKLKSANGELSAAQRAEVFRALSDIVAATTDRYERQAVVPDGAHVLAEAGLLDRSDELLKYELPRAVAPYYHMLVLGGNAAKRHDNKAALSWYEQAWRKSEGPATRIQWGAGFVGHLLELDPADAARVESAAGAVIGQLAPKSETFYERNQRSLQKMAKRLLKWEGSDPARQRSVAKIKSQLAKTCARLPAKDPGRTNCESVFSPTTS
jgi:thioredoxin-like negative regulator of GroEL